MWHRLWTLWQSTWGRLLSSLCWRQPTDLWWSREKFCVENCTTLTNNFIVIISLQLVNVSSCLLIIIHYQNSSTFSSILCSVHDNWIEVCNANWHVAHALLNSDDIRMLRCTYVFMHLLKYIFIYLQKTKNAQVMINSMACDEQYLWVF